MTVPLLGGVRGGSAFNSHRSGRGAAQCRRSLAAAIRSEAPYDFSCHAEEAEAVHLRHRRHADDGLPDHADHRGHPGDDHLPAAAGATRPSSTCRRRSCRASSGQRWHWRFPSHQSRHRGSRRARPPKAAEGGVVRPGRVRRVHRVDQDRLGRRRLHDAEGARLAAAGHFHPVLSPSMLTRRARAARGPFCFWFSFCSTFLWFLSAASGFNGPHHKMRMK